MAANAISGESTSEMHDTEATPHISSMALYNLSRAHSLIAALASKPKWTNADTAPFDCMHYDGDAALERCASAIGLRPDQRVLDIGSGFGATGRFLASTYGARVTGIELQRENHELARLITVRNVDAGVVKRVRSVNADFLRLEPEGLGVVGRDGEAPSSSSSSFERFDHVISLLCIMHIPESDRSALFRQAARFLKSGGKMYIEDFYDKSSRSDGLSNLTERELHQLHEIVACPYLPSASEYTSDVAAAGFDSIEFEDVSEKWTQWVRARAEKYRASEKPNAELQKFYDTVAEIFEGGRLGGVRLTAVRR